MNHDRLLGGAEEETALRAEPGRSFAAASDARQFVSHIKQEWKRGQAPDAAWYLSRFPRLADQKSLALDLAYEEYCLREEAGESIDVSRFCEKFPLMERSLARQIEVHQYLVRSPSIRQSAERVSWPEPGGKLFEFTVLEELGRGAFARVYLCCQSGVGDRQVVVKVAYQGDYEAETLGRLNHPNIMPIYSVAKDVESHVSCLCMPFRGRSTLCDVLDAAFAASDHPLHARVIFEAASMRRAASDQYDRVEPADPRLCSVSYVEAVVLVGQQLVRALQHAHEQGILHGDLKPSNVLVTPAGTPLLLDFNLSRDRQKPAAMTGGTLPYMSPEQIRSTVLDGNSTAVLVDERSDVFSLGAILYELLCGKLPFGRVDDTAGTRQAARQLWQSQHLGPRPLRRTDPHVDAPLARLIESCLAFDRANRPASMSVVAAGLARHFSVPRRGRRWARVHRRAVLASAVGLVVSSGAGAAYLIRREPYAVRQYERGLLLYSRREFKEALECFNAALSEDPQLADVYYRRGRTFVQLGEYAFALEDFDRATERSNDGLSEACYGYCLNRSSTNLVDEAIAKYEKAISAEYESVGLYNNLGYCYLRRRQIEKARKCYGLAISMGAETPEIYFNRACLELAEARRRNDGLTKFLQEGLACIEKAVELAPACHELRFRAAQLYSLASRHDPAYMEKSLSCLSAAVRLGLDMSQNGIGDDPVFEPLRNDLRFRAIRESHVTNAVPQNMDHYVDPVQDLSNGLRG